MNPRSPQIWGAPELLARTPASRAGDGSGSHNAEAYINRSGKRALSQRRALVAFYHHPMTTTREAAVLAGLDRYDVARVAPELYPVYLDRRDGGDGFRWHLTETGKRLVEDIIINHRDEG